MRIGGTDVRTVLVSVTAAGIMWLVQTVVAGASTEAVLTERIAAHEARLKGLEEVAAELAKAQARTAAVQEALEKMLERTDGRTRQ